MRIVLLLSSNKNLPQRRRKVDGGLIFILASLILLSGCDKCGNPEPPPPDLRFVLIDEATNLSLLGPDRLYHPDTINNLNRSTSKIRAYNDSLLYFNYEYIPDGENQVFFLNSVERDTLQVRFTEVDGMCYTYKDLTEFRYNGNLIQMEERLYRVPLNQ